MLFNRREVVEMMLRPILMNASTENELVEYYMQKEPSELACIFNKETRLQIMPIGCNLFEIKY